MDPSDWLSRSRAAIWHPCTQMKQHDTGALPLIPIDRGQGAWLYDFAGRRYLDAISSWWVNLFGHANPRINAAVKDQLDRLEHVILAGFTHAPAVELSERLSALTGGALGHCFYASDGSSAVEIALKMSFHYWRNHGQPEKNRFLCLADSYHGETLGTLSVGDVGLYKDAYAPLLRQAATVPSPDARQAAAGETAMDCARRAATALEAYLAEHHGSIAALIVEPLVQGAGGMVMYDPEYLRLARALCDRYQVHLIADEIMVGFGRTGTLFAHEQAGVRPDLLCLSKGLTGGYLPLSVVLSTDQMFAAFYDDEITRGFLHSHSYTGNPLACRAALATLDIFAEDGVLERNRRFAERFTVLLEPLAKHPQARHFRHCGMIWAVDIASDDPEFRLRFYREALHREVLLRPLGTTIYFMPPYILDAAEAALLAEGAVAALEAALMIWDELDASLAQLAAEGLLRRRRTLEAPCGPDAVVESRSVVAFCSNDYLGLANHPSIVAAAQQAAGRWGVGSGASHVVSGHLWPHAELEERLAAFVGREQALYFTTGYMANLSIAPALVERNDAIFADKLNHASLIDAALLARAEHIRYPHGDLETLTRRLEQSRARRKLILTDAVFSMDGDLAPLPELFALAERFDAWLVVDDAHGFGVGPGGRGSLAHFKLPPSPRLILMGTLGKAAGVSGAFVAGDRRVIDWLMQRARPYIFTTASSPIMAGALLTSLELIANGDDRRAHLQQLIVRLKSGLDGLPWSLLPSQTAIQPLLVGGNEAAVQLAERLFARGLWVPAIRPPTVPVGAARLRITLSAAHSETQVDALTAALRECANDVCA